MYIAQQLISDCLALLMSKSSFSTYPIIKNSPPRMEFCSNLNASKCSISEDFYMNNGRLNDQNTELLVNVYNPIAHELKHYL